MGLVQRAIEARGIPTVGISLVRRYTEQVRPPRTIYLKWPFGHPLGEPGNRSQQVAVLRDMLKALQTIEEPGTIMDSPYRWRREDYPEPWGRGLGT